MKKILLSAIAIAITCLGYAQSDSLRYTGAVQMYIVPQCVDSLVLQVYGASGANANNDGRASNSRESKGSYAKGTLKVMPGDTIYVYVGGAGDTTGISAYNGGGKGGFGSAGASCDPGYGGGGGGASDVRYKDTAHASRVIVGGGGAGAGRDYCNGGCQPCGGGGSGGSVGGNGFNGSAANNCGFGYPGGDTNFGNGGTQVAPGKGGNGNGSLVNIGSSGVQWQGGGGSNGTQDVAGGGGGGGYFGGGGGGGASNGSGVGGGGGGGGSSYIGGVVGGMVTDSINDSNGWVIITPIIGASAPVIDSLVFDKNDSIVTVYAKGGILPGDSNYYTYAWSTGSSTSSTKANLSGKYYRVCVTSPYGCGTVCDSVLFLNTAGIASINGQGNSIDIFPNPNGGKVTIALKNAGYKSIVIYDIIGRPVYSRVLDEAQRDYSVNIDMSNLSNGSYMVQILTDTGIIHKDITLQK